MRYTSDSVKQSRISTMEKKEISGDDGAYNTLVGSHSLGEFSIMIEEEVTTFHSSLAPLWGCVMQVRHKISRERKLGER